MALEAWRERAEALEAEVYAVSLAARDPRTPLLAKGLIGFAVAYAVSPIDPIPDVIPGLGYLDEVILLPAIVGLALRVIPDEVMAECRDRADGEIDVGRARWAVAVVVVLAWLCLAAVVYRAVLS